MIMEGSRIHCDLLVIGAGMAGASAALFAANRGLKTVLTGSTGSLQFASGLMDLLGIHSPTAAHTPTPRPWEALNALGKDLPMHPYARINPTEIRKAFSEFTGLLAKASLPYYCEPEHNLQIITSLGSVKTTYLVPESMRHNALSFFRKPPCLLIDFEGLKGFSARQIRESLGKSWPSLRYARVSLNGASGKYYPQHLASELENSAIRNALIQSIRNHLQGEKVVGLPAVLGISAAAFVHAELEKELGVNVFEIPMLPPSMPGLRLKEALEKLFPGLGIQTLLQRQVLKVSHTEEDGFTSYIGPDEPLTMVRSQGILLASGRFFGKGLHATRKGIRETIFNLPVHQPESRAHWHHENLLHPQGHPINQAGLETDTDFRPLNKDGKPAFPTLYAAGSILAHHDWTRLKCGSGISLATAHGAVEAFLQTRARSSG